MALYRLLQPLAFNDQDVEAITEAYEAVLVAGALPAAPTLSPISLRGRSSLIARLMDATPKPYGI